MIPRRNAATLLLVAATVVLDGVAGTEVSDAPSPAANCRRKFNRRIGKTVLVCDDGRAFVEGAPMAPRRPVAEFPSPSTAETVGFTDGDEAAPAPAPPGICRRSFDRRIGRTVLVCDDGRTFVLGASYAPRRPAVDPGRTASAESALGSTDPGLSSPGKRDRVDARPAPPAVCRRTFNPRIGRTVRVCDDGRARVEEATAAAAGSTERRTEQSLFFV